jgi:hypothetical protein
MACRLKKVAGVSRMRKVCAVCAVSGALTFHDFAFGCQSVFYIGVNKGVYRVLGAEMVHRRFRAWNLHSGLD